MASIQNPWVARLGLVMLVAALVVTAIVRFYHRHTDIPKDCDEPGYLEMAEAMHRGKTFDDPVERPFHDGLVQHLQAEEYTVSDYGWLLSPLPYHLEPHTGKLINQYPPGTGFVLSFIPIEHRTVLFPGVLALLFFAISLLALRLLSGSNHTAFQRGAWWTLVLFLLFIMSSPINVEFSRISSVGMTYGLILGAGILFRKKPEWALVCLGLACTFRIAHVIFLAPIGLQLLWVRVIEPGKHKEISAWLKHGLIAGAAFVFGGFMWYLIYTYQLMGNPFWPTYGGLDVNFAQKSGFLENVAFYLIPGQNWFGVHLVAIAILFAGTRLGWITNKWFVFLVATVAFNYLFFCTHKVAVPYYPHASAILLLGAIIEALACHDKAPKPIAIIRWSIPVVILVLIGISVTKPKFGQHEQLFEQQVAAYQSAFDGYHVVWAHFHTSTIEYAIKKPSFTLLWAKAEVQASALHWLAANGYRQVIWLDDLEIPALNLEKRLHRAKLSYRKEYSEQFGSLYVIEPYAGLPSDQDANPNHENTQAID